MSGMIREFRVVIVLTMLIFWGTPILCGQPTPDHEKLRIFVDKAILNSIDGGKGRGKVLTEDVVQEIVNAGFNVVVSSRGSESMGLMRQAAGWAGKAGASFMPWMRMAIPAKDVKWADIEGPGKEAVRFVGDDGHVTPIYSPNDDRWWDWLSDRLVSYARISKGEPALMGVMLDFEVYVRPKKPLHVFPLSYDMKILTEFCQSKGVDIPKLPPEKRKSWLEKKGLYEDFAAFQISSWRKHCKEIRKRIDAINPKFRICLYPGNDTDFVLKAAYPEWSTKQAPLIVANPKTYGRITPVELRPAPWNDLSEKQRGLPHKQGLENNRKILLEKMGKARKLAKQYGVPLTYLSGIDPVKPGADQEFSAKNAVMISSLADGYWVFYEGPSGDYWIGKKKPSHWTQRFPYLVHGWSDHELYMHWFWWANRKIQQKDWKAAWQPRETPDAYEKKPQKKSPAKATDDKKLRILVDKTYINTINQGGGKRQILTEDVVRQIVDAGFNVITPRYGAGNMDLARKASRWAGKYGASFMPWMRATKAAKKGSLRYVAASGVQPPVCSPNSDELWEWLTDYIVSYAKVSKDEPALMGVFLDFEMYAEPDTGHGYNLSFDSKIIKEFADSKGIKIPELAPDKRKAWFEEKGLFKDFAAFQENSWRIRCRELRKKVDEINPKFRFCVYTYDAPPAGTLFLQTAAYPEWSTRKAPLIRAESKTYGRPGPLPQKVALEANRKKLTGRQEEAKALGKKYNVPVTYISGLDPVAPGADPEFCGKSAVMISDVADGYWVFYEGPSRVTSECAYLTPGFADHKLFTHWFWWANRKISQKDWKAALQPRETRGEEDGAATSVNAKTDKIQVILCPMSKKKKFSLIAPLEETNKFELHPLDALTLDYLASADVVVLQNYNQDVKFDDKTVQVLRKYVQQGGGLMLTHDTVWYMASPVPEVAERATPEHKSNVESDRHVVGVDLMVSQEHAALGKLQKGIRFKPEFRDHMIFVTGNDGTAVIKNALGDPVYVVGEFGKGRIAFVGSYYGYRGPLKGAEKEAYVSLVEWLAGGRQVDIRPKKHALRGDGE